MRDPSLGPRAKSGSGRSSARSMGSHNRPVNVSSLPTYPSPVCRRLFLLPIGWNSGLRDRDAESQGRAIACLEETSKRNADETDRENDRSGQYISSNI